MTADELDALMAQFTDEQLLAAFSNRFRTVIVCAVKPDPIARPTQWLVGESIIEAQCLAAALVQHIHQVSVGITPITNTRPEEHRQ